jgi:hypothetical protein
MFGDVVLRALLVSRVRGALLPDEAVQALRIKVPLVRTKLWPRSRLQFVEELFRERGEAPGRLHHVRHGLDVLVARLLARHILAIIPPRVNDCNGCDVFGVDCNEAARSGRGT